MASSGYRQQTLYEGNLVHALNPEKLTYAFESHIGVDESGKIAFIEQHSSASDVLAKHGWASYTPIVSATEVMRTRNATAFFFPGFIDTHTHASQYPNVGIFGDSTLLDWLEKYTFPLESSFTALDRARLVYDRVVRRSLSHGTTASAYYATVHVPATNLLAEICHKRGQRALVGRVCMDRMSPEHYQDESPETAVQATQACIDYIQQLDPTGELIRPVITPRFAPSCTDHCLSALGKLHKETGHWVQTHMSENKSEIELVKTLFPLAKDYASVYDEAGLLTDKTIIAHAVHMTSDEIRLMEKRQTKISHCPTSNTCLTSGAAKVKQLLKAGIDVSLGTDMSGGYSPSILEMVRQAILVSRHTAMVDGDEAKLSISEALWLATKGGAKCMGLEKHVGAFEIGMDFDAQLIVMDHINTDIDDAAVNGAATEPHLEGPVDIFGWESPEDKVAKWVYGGDDRNVAAVWVKGRLVHKIRNVTLIDE